MISLENAQTVNDTCNVLAVTIIAETQRGEIRTIVDHSPEVTRNEDGETRTIICRVFPRRVACPVSAARQLAIGARALYPHAIVNLVNA